MLGNIFLFFSRLGRSFTSFRLAKICVNCITIFGPKKFPKTKNPLESLHFTLHRKKNYFSLWFCQKLLTLHTNKQLRAAGSARKNREIDDILPHVPTTFFDAMKCVKIQSLWNSFGIILNEFTRGGTQRSKFYFVFMNTESFPYGALIHLT